jgi:hypothetical protein
MVTPDSARRCELCRVPDLSIRLVRSCRFPLAGVRMRRRAQRWAGGCIKPVSYGCLASGFLLSIHWTAPILVSGPLASQAEEKKMLGSYCYVGDVHE